VVEYFPVPQSTQALSVVDPVAVLYLPESQSLQSLISSWPSTLLYLPTPHGLQSVAAFCATASLYFPVAQAVQAVADDDAPCPKADDQRPTGQSLHALTSVVRAVNVPYLPTPQSLQL
jgi:hypothetical protein